MESFLILLFAIGNIAFWGAIAPGPLDLPLKKPMFSMTKHRVSVLLNHLYSYFSSSRYPHRMRSPIELVPLKQEFCPTPPPMTCESSQLSVYCYTPGSCGCRRLPFQQSNRSVFFHGKLEISPKVGMIIRLIALESNKIRNDPAIFLSSYISVKNFAIFKCLACTRLFC